jgi:hypothetical protein
MDTMKKSIQGFQMMSEKLNTQMGEMMTELMNKADNRRVEKIEMQLYQFALKENVEKLALQIDAKAPRDELNKLQQYTIANLQEVVKRLDAMTTKQEFNEKLTSTKNQLQTEMLAFYRVSDFQAFLKSHNAEITRIDKKLKDIDIMFKERDA